MSSDAARDSLFHIFTVHTKQQKKFPEVKILNEIDFLAFCALRFYCGIIGNSENPVLSPHLRHLFVRGENRSTCLLHCSL